MGQHRLPSNTYDQTAGLDNDGKDVYDAIIGRLNTCARMRRTTPRPSSFEDGFGGMQIHGFLSADGVKELRKNLASRAWTASYMNRWTVASLMLPSTSRRC